MWFVNLQPYQISVPGLTRRRTAIVVRSTTVRTGQQCLEFLVGCRDRIAQRADREGSAATRPSALQKLIAIGWDAAVIEMIVDTTLAGVSALIVGHAGTMGSSSVAELRVRRKVIAWNSRREM